MADELIRSEIRRNDHYVESRGSSRNQPGPRMSSTQLTPIDAAPSVSLLAPPETRSPKHRTTTTGYRNTVSIHEQLYADGWNNGEGTSTQDGEVDDYTSAWLTQLTLDLAKENRQPKTSQEPRRMPASCDTYYKTRNTLHRENPEMPRRMIQDDFSERRRVRQELTRTREAGLREEEEAARRYKPPPPRTYQVDGHSTRVVSDSDASRKGREYLRQRESAWTKPQGGRSSGEREDDRRFTDPAHGRKDARHQEKLSPKEERRRRKKSRDNRRSHRRKFSSSESSSSSENSDDDSSDSSGSDSDEQTRKSRRNRRGASRDWKSRREVQAWRI